MTLQNARMINGAADRNGLKDATCEQGLKLTVHDLKKMIFQSRIRTSLLKDDDESLWSSIVNVYIIRYKEAEFLRGT